MTARRLSDFMVAVFINPGSGPVANADELSAIENIKQFVKDCEEMSGVKGIQWERHAENDDRGRFGFYLWTDSGADHEVEMPGLPLEQVRYVDSETQNIWDFPRLYVDGSSWVWKFAVLKDQDDWAARSRDGLVL